MEYSNIAMEEQLQELGIFALRELARRTGVNSPTSKKKDELIKEIVEINNGVKKPQTVTKLGWPPKSYGYDISNIFSYNKNQTISNDNVIVLNQDVSVEDDNLLRCRGVVEILSSTVAFLWMFKDGKYFNFYIPNALIENYNLKSGDSCFVLVETKDGQMIVKDLLTVNSIPIAKYSGKRKDFFKIDHIQNKEEILFKSNKFSNIKINKGENFYIYGSNPNENTDFVINLLNDVKIDNRVYLNVSIVEKTKHILNKFNSTELYVANLTDDLEMVRRVITLATERLMRVLEDGEDVLIVIDDVVSLTSVDLQDLSLLKKLMSLTKKGKAGSITIVAIMNKDQSVAQIEKLADSRFYL